MRDVDHPETRLLLGMGNDSAIYRTDGGADEVVRGQKNEWEL